MANKSQAETDERHFRYATRLTQNPAVWLYLQECYRPELLAVITAAIEAHIVSTGHRLADPNILQQEAGEAFLRVIGFVPDDPGKPKRPPMAFSAHRRAILAQGVRYDSGGITSKASPSADIPAPAVATGSTPLDSGIPDASEQSVSAPSESVAASRWLADD